MTGTGPAIVCRSLTKKYGDVTAVDSLNLTIGRGEVFGLLGPNGAGKTTTILMMLGLTEPSSGGVSVLGLQPARQALAVKSQVGYLPDAVGFYPELTGRQNLRYTARLNGLAPKTAAARIDEALATVGLADRGDDPARVYSRGMMQRLGIADALIKDPKVLILDEPTVGLDPRGTEQILDTIATLARDRNVTVLLSSHLLDQVQAICHRIGIFVRGTLLAAGSISELSRRNTESVTIEVRTASGDPAPILRRLAGVTEVTTHDGPHVVLAERDIREDIATQLARAGMTVVHLRLREPDLADLYRHYFEGAKAVVS